jgi:drug/metabolite transporter (DMT)-like permease
MNYNFELVLILLVIISSPITFIKKDILNNFSIFEEIICTSFFIFTITFIVYFYYEKKSLKHLTNKYINSPILHKYLIYILLIVFSLYIGNYIISKENKIIKYRAFRSSFSLILALILSIFIFKEKLNFNQLLGILIIILGIYIYNNKKI